MYSGIFVIFRLENCRNAMTLAKTHFDIPLVVRPEDLSSADLDELSGMTYLSYFMKLDSPGYHQTLNLVRKLLRHGTVNDFTVRTSEFTMGELKKYQIFVILVLFLHSKATKIC